VSDGILGTGFDAVTAKDATAVIDVVNGSISFIDTGALFGGPRIVGSNDVDTLGGTRRGAKITGHTLLAAQLVNMQEVLPAITWRRVTGSSGY